MPSRSGTWTYCLSRVRTTSASRLGKTRRKDDGDDIGNDDDDDNDEAVKFITIVEDISWIVNYKFI